MGTDVAHPRKSAQPSEPATVDGPVKSCHPGSPGVQGDRSLPAYPLPGAVGATSHAIVKGSVSRGVKRSRVLRMFAMVVVLWIDTGTVDETAATSLCAPPIA